MIDDHLRVAVRQGGTEQVLYMAGMPGTGKTASLTESIRQLQDNPKVGPTVFVHVNAMRLGTPAAVFSDILTHLPGVEKCSASGSCAEVHRFFSSRKKTDPVVILLIDEIDQLVTRSQGVLYKVFDLLSLRGARLVLTAISNTMDLPERLLPRVASRFEIIRVDFWPYNRDQIQSILMARLVQHNATDAYTADALKICAARVASGSGDVRKALQLCLRSLEIFQGGAVKPPARSQPLTTASGKPAGEECVQHCHLMTATRDLLFANPVTSVIGTLSNKPRRFLIAILQDLRNKDTDVVPLRTACSRYEKLMKLGCSGTVGGAASTWTQPSNMTHFDDGEEMAKNLLSMNVLAERGNAKTTKNGNVADAGVVIALGGGLDPEDLTTALLNVEEDAGLVSLLKDWS